MATKNNPGAYDCYASAAPDEPLFVLLGRDRHAPTLVWLWAALRERDGEEPAKVEEARRCVADMMTWADAHGRQTVGVDQAAIAAVLELMRTAKDAIDLLRPDPARETTHLEALRLRLAGHDLRDE